MQNPTQSDFGSLRKPLTLASVGAAKLLPVGPNYVFELMHKASRVELAVLVVGKDAEGKDITKPYWLPTLVPFTHAGGVNGVKAGLRADDPPNVINAKARKQNEGWIFIPSVETYIDEYPCEHPKAKLKGTFYCTKFDRPKAVGSEFILDHDDQGDGLWRHGLVLSGLLPKPDPIYCERKMRSTIAAVRRHDGKSEKFHVAATSQHENYLALMKAAIRPGDPGDPLDPSQAKSEPEKADGGRRAKA